MESRANHVLEVGDKELKVVILQPGAGAQSEGPAVEQVDHSQPQHLSLPGSAELRAVQRHRDGAAEVLTKKVRREELCRAAPLCRWCPARPVGKAEQCCSPLHFSMSYHTSVVVALSMQQEQGATLECSAATHLHINTERVPQHGFGTVSPKTRPRQVWHTKDCSQWRDLTLWHSTSVLQKTCSRSTTNGLSELLN